MTVRKRAAGRGRAGKLWWREAWMGQVATDAFAQAREDARPQPHSARAHRAQDVAAQRGRERAAGLGMEAARGEARVARAKAMAIWHAPLATAHDEAARAATSAVAAAVGRWRAERRLEAREPEGASRGSAAAAERILREESPMGSQAEEAERGRAVRELALAIEQQALGQQALGQQAPGQQARGGGGEGSEGGAHPVKRQAVVAELGMRHGAGLCIVSIYGHGCAIGMRCV